MFWVLSGIPFVMFQTNTNWRILGISVCVTLGIGSVILGIFSEQEDYKKLIKEPLLFDYEFMKELSIEYHLVKRKYQLIAIPCIFLFVVGFLIIALTMGRHMEWTEYHSFAFLGFAIGLLGFVQSIGTMDAYELLVKNEQYCDRLSFKIRRKLKRKFEN